MKHFHPLYDTPQGLRQLESMSARLRSKLSRKTPPSKQMLAWADYRQERYIEPGLEGLSGADATYHLTIDVPRLLLQALHLLDTNNADPTLPPPKMRPSAALDDLVKAYGFRCLRGVDGIKDALAEQGATRERIDRFMDEREAFAGMFAAHMDAAYVVNKSGENPNAVRSALVMFVAEMERLCDWLTVAGQQGVADATRGNLATVLDLMDSQQSRTHMARQSSSRRG